MNALPIGLGAVLVAVALMAWDHLWGNQGGADDSFPVMVAGGGVALGLRALDGSHRRMAVIAVALGVAVIVFGVMATAFPPADTD